MNIEDILNSFGVKYTKKPELFSVLCPFHPDIHPSACINQKTGAFNCWSCKKRTTIVSFLSKITNSPVQTINAKIGYKTDCKNPISPTDIEADHLRIWQHQQLLDALHHRCITDELIRKYRLGSKTFGEENRICIPIPNDIGEYATIRLYLPGATERKFTNLLGKDRSKTRLYPIEQLEYDTILVCGGELKAVAAAAVLNQYDIGAIAPTCGENSWPSEYNDRFANKLVYINCDVDATGEKYSEIRCRILQTVARAVHKVIFTPEMVGSLPKGDMNDFLRLGGDLYKLIIDSKEWILVPGGEILEELATESTFHEAYAHSNVGKKLKFKGVVASVNANSFLAPVLVEVQCNRNEEFCTICDVNSQAMTSQLDTTIIGTEMKISEEHPCLLAIIGEKTEEHRKIYKTNFRIPQNCRQCNFEVKKSTSLVEVRLDEQVDATSRSEAMSMRSAYVVNSNILIEQQTYNITGRLYPSPKNQVSTFLISSLETTMDSLDSYSSDDSEELQIFVPNNWTVESVEAKLDDIYADFESNITKIYQRRDYHLLIDLVYHSILNFKLGDNKNVNGWVEALVIGDTGQGKSEASKYIQKHYGLGVSVDCKNATLPGLTIGLDRGPNKYFAVYGVYPKNDKKLVIFEELIGMNHKVFQAMTEVRSSGNVQITKIDSKIRKARVRLLAISNPPPFREIASYTYGIEAALGVIGTNEDLRRFDATLIMAKSDIDQDALTKTLLNVPVVEHKYTADLSMKLVLKAWKCEDIEFEDIAHILLTSRSLVGIFGDGTPILDNNTSHLKLAKLSAALAARTHSYIDGVLFVRKCHVELIAKFLTRIYSSSGARLDEKSKAVRCSSMLRDKDGLLAYIKGINNAANITLKLSEIDEISGRFVQDLCGDFYVGTTLFARLIQSNAITRIKGDRYSKTSEFNKLLANNRFELEIPDYIRKEKF